MWDATSNAPPLSAGDAAPVGQELELGVGPTLGVEPVPESELGVGLQSSTDSVRKESVGAMAAAEIPSLDGLLDDFVDEVDEADLPVLDELPPASALCKRPRVKSDACPAQSVSMAAALSEEQVNLSSLGVGALTPLLRGQPGGEGGSRSNPSGAEALLRELQRVVGGASPTETLARALGKLKEGNQATTPPAEWMDADLRLHDQNGFGLVVMDMHVNFRRWNSTMQNLLGYPKELMSSLNMAHVTHSEELPAMQMMMQSICQMANLPTARSPISMHKRCVTRSGANIDVPVRLSVADGGYFACLVDVHARVNPLVNQPPGFLTSTSPSSADSASGCGGTRRKRRTPLPAAAVTELKELLGRQLHPSLDLRAELAAKYGLERRQVDRWCENARARGIAAQKKGAGK